MGLKMGEKGVDGPIEPKKGTDIDTVGGGSKNKGSRCLVDVGMRASIITTRPPDEPGASTLCTPSS